MISFAPLNYGIIFLLFSSKPSHSQEIDFLEIEKKLINLMSDIKADIISLQNDIRGVKTSVDTLDAKSDCSKIEENLISTMKDIIRSENEGLKKKLNEAITSMNISATLDLLRDNQYAVESRLEKALSKMEENIIKDISEAAKNTSLDVSSSKDLLMKNQDAAQSKSEKDHLELEERLIKYISEAEKNISLSVSSCKGNKITFPKGSSKYNIEDGDTCYTSDGEEGTCVAFQKCSKIKKLVILRGGMQTNGTADIVRKRICNFRFKEPKVCWLPETIPNDSILPSHDECGFTFGQKIVGGGEHFTHGVHPWLVGIGYLQDRKSIKVECGGTLITKRHVLSAAHCFDRTHNVDFPQYTHVILGEHSLSEETERKPPIILKIVDRRNPGYNVSHHYKDIELLTLERDVEFGDYIRPACLPFKQYEKGFNFDRNAVIVGWGKTTHTGFQGTDGPMQAEVPVVPLDKCKDFYEPFKNLLIDETQICLGGNGKDTCRVDSGAPVIYLDIPNTFRHFVIGISAFGIGCGHTDFPGVYTYVPAYLNWILNNLV